MKRYYTIGFVGFLLFPNLIFAANTFNIAISNQLSSHYKQYHEMEYFSGMSLSISIPKKPIQSFYTGRVSHDANSEKVNNKTLFQIGSLTKSFTAALILTLEKENKLSLDDGVDKWLSQYGKWSKISLTSLLNMSSGLPNYSDTPLWNSAEYENPKRVWSSWELIKFVYPKDEFSPPLKENYFYSNTGYVLLDMIVERATKAPFNKLLREKVIEKAKLTNTFYPVPTATTATMKRLASGYNYNQYDNPSLVGSDMKTNNLTWGGAAGAMVSNSEDIIKWVQALFVDKQLLDEDQKKKLTSLVSVSTGKPISNVSKSDPRGFGLGVIQSYDAKMGRFWFYEGETLGYRALYMYVPCNKVIISSIFNSATNSENDHAGELMKKVYAKVISTYPKLACKS